MHCHLHTETYRAKTFHLISFEDTFCYALHFFKEMPVVLKLSCAKNDKIIAIILYSEGLERNLFLFIDALISESIDVLHFQIQSCFYIILGGV